MSEQVEVVMPNIGGARPEFPDFPSAARVVSTPSARDIDRIFIIALESLEAVDGLEALRRIRAEEKRAPLVFFSSGESFGIVDGQHRMSAIAEVLQHLALAVSKPTESPFIAPDRDAVTRIVRAHLSGAEKALIATARIRGDELWVWSCEPRLYRCKVAELRPLREMNAEALARFELSKSGSRLHWPSSDVDLNLESIRAVADPGVRAAQERHYRKDARRYAKAIRVLREEMHLAQSDIEGLSDRAVRRIELGERIPHSSTLQKLARAHGMELDEYMGRLAQLSSTRARP